MSNKKEDKTLRRKRRKEKEEVGGNSVATIYRLMNSEAPLHGCWISQEWQTAGFACIVVARKMNTGLIMFVMFWLDLAKGIVEDCWGKINLTEERLQTHILRHDPKLEFLQAELDLVKEVIAGVVAISQKKGYALPDDYPNCLKLIGTVERPSKPITPKSLASPTEAKHYKFIYATKDSEALETELLQLPMLQEAESSTLLQKRFLWSVAKKKHLFFKQENDIWADLILEGNSLTVEADDQTKLATIHSSLLNYLGTAIVLKEKVG